MRSTALLAVLFCVFVNGASFAAKDEHGDDHRHEGKHGGVVVEVSDVDYEFVAKPDLLQLYATDHGKAVDLKGASATATLYSGRDKQEVKLVAFADRLEAKGDFKVTAGAKAIVLVTLKGKPVHRAQFTLK